jgi:hypothetical protein
MLPRINPLGELHYPCRPFGTMAGNILDYGSYDRTVEAGIRKHGPPPHCENPCQLRCYIESSLAVKKPWLVAGEFFRQNKEIPSKELILSTSSQF